MPAPFDQSAYQVRFEWGVDGLARLDPADIVVVVDVLRFSTIVTDAVAAGTRIALSDAVGWSRNGATVVASAAADAHVLIGGIRNAAAVARAVQTVQEQRGRRTSIAVIAAGEADAEGIVRVAVEDQLGAGAVIAALTDRGIDHTSPEAAFAAEGFRALRGALRHLISASGSAREIADGLAVTARIEAAGIRAPEVAAAAELDAVDVVPVLCHGVFVRF